MNIEGWINWMVQRPPEKVLIQIMRDEWDKPSTMIVEPTDLTTARGQNQAMMNINGLYWRLTEISKEQP